MIDNCFLKGTCPPAPAGGVPLDKHGTTTVGLSATGTVGIPKTPLKVSLAVTGGVAFNKKEARGFGSVGGTFGAGKGGKAGKFGESAVVGVTVGHHNGDPVDTGGPFTHVEGSVGEGVAVSGQHYWGKSADGSREVHGTSFTVGLGEGISGGGGGSSTAVTPTAKEMAEPSSGGEVDSDKQYMPGGA